MHTYSIYTQEKVSFLQMQGHGISFSSNATPNPWAFYSFIQGHHQLSIMIANPSEKQIKSFQSEKAEFALFPQEDFFLFLCRLGELPWLAAPYQWHRIPKEQRSLPDIWNPALLQVSFVDSSAGNTCAMRDVTLSQEFTASLCGAILLQAATPFSGEHKYELSLHKLLEKYPSIASLVPMTTARTIDML